MTGCWVYFRKPGLNTFPGKCPSFPLALGWGLLPCWGAKDLPQIPAVCRVVSWTQDTKEGGVAEVVPAGPQGPTVGPGKR